MAKEYVILVDQNDASIGCMEKIEAHEKGLLHRAFSIFVFRERRGRLETLLQKRSERKYHFGGLWSNTCCGHPRQGESTREAAMRRLLEEMHIDCALTSIGQFRYSARSPNGLVEHEIDHVMAGTYDEDAPDPNPEEVGGHRWMTVEALDAELESKPETFTPWFESAYGIFRQSYRNAVRPS